MKIRLLLMLGRYRHLIELNSLIQLYNFQMNLMENMWVQQNRGDTEKWKKFWIDLRHVAKISKRKNLKNHNLLPQAQKAQIQLQNLMPNL